MMQKRFVDKVVLVTGASKGIGRATANRFALEGAQVVINYNRSEEDALDLQSAIKDTGGSASICRASVDNEEEVLAMFSQIRREFGRLDVLVNNAGITDDGYVATMSLNKWERPLRVNLTGAFLCTRSALSFMAPQGSGVVVIVSSVSGLIGLEGQANYAAAKGGLIAFTKSVAKEAARYGIRVNAVVPGFIETDMLRALPAQFLDGVQNNTQLKRIGQPDEIAGIVLFMASEEASYVTGQMLVADGGMVF